MFFIYIIITSLLTFTNNIYSLLPLHIHPQRFWSVCVKVYNSFIAT